MPSVLVVEDERDLAGLLRFNLEQDGYATRVVHTGAAALASARAEPVELVLLDVMLPDLSGLEVCRMLKGEAGPKAPRVILLSARIEEEVRIEGFQAGADDYVTKPFSVRELLLRARAVLRRTGVGAVPATGGGDPRLNTLRVGALELDVDAHRCLLDGKDLVLTALEFKLLHHLMSRPGRVHTRESLLEDVWGMSRELETRTVDTHVMRLREKLGRAKSYLETVRGVGYRLTEQGS